MPPDVPEARWSPSGPWPCYNYAFLHAKGVNHLFDTMRYDNAFLARPADLALLESLAGEGMEFAVAPLAVLLCRPAESGKPGWTHQRLLRNQRFEEVLDSRRLTHELSNVGPAGYFKAKPVLRWRGVVEVTSVLRGVLRIMFTNRAVPADEGSARRIEDAYYRIAEPVTVSLATYRAARAPWDFSTDTR